MQIPWLNSYDPAFPETDSALDHPNGLLAAGGALNTIWLKNAYSRGIFPWYSDGEPILWWSPSPRMIFFPERLHFNRTVRKALRRSTFTHITFDQCFDQVISACAHRPDQGTWITDEMLLAYINAHQAGLAHSVEVWENESLVGGLYGICINQVFFGESMFSRIQSASRYALKGLIIGQPGLKLIDCQLPSENLLQMGGEQIDRCQFEQFLAKFTTSKLKFRPERIILKSDLLD